MNYKTKARNMIKFQHLPTRISQFLCTLFALFLTVALINQTAQGQGPCNAHRYNAGDGWRYNTTSNKWEANGPVNGNDQPLGIVACGSAAQTENNLQVFQHAYDPSLFTVTPSCFAGPASGQKIIWYNFDIRPFAGTFQFLR